MCGLGREQLGAAALPPASWVQTFIMDWWQRVAEHPKGLQCYEVSFYAKLPMSDSSMWCSTSTDPATDKARVLTCPAEPTNGIELNVSTIIYGVEGCWFRVEWVGQRCEAAPRGR